MGNEDMVCYIAAGEFQIKKDDKEFTVKEGEMYTCTKGTTDMATNTSNVVGNPYDRHAEDCLNARVPA